MPFFYGTQIHNELGKVLEPFNPVAPATSYNSLNRATETIGFKYGLKPLPWEAKFPNGGSFSLEKVYVLAVFNRTGEVRRNYETGVPMRSLDKLEFRFCNGLNGGTEPSQMLRGFVCEEDATIMFQGGPAPTAHWAIKRQAAGLQAVLYVVPSGSTTEAVIVPSSRSVLWAGVAYLDLPDAGVESVRLHGCDRLAIGGGVNPTVVYDRRHDRTAGLARVQHVHKHVEEGGRVLNYEYFLLGDVVTAGSDELPGHIFNGQRVSALDGSPVELTERTSARAE